MYYKHVIKKVTKGLVMLSNMKIAIFGGDGRHIEIIKKLSELDARVYLIGYEQLEQFVPGVIKEKLENLHLAEMDAIILPVSGTGENGEIESIFSNETIKLTEDILCQLKESCIIFTGISNSYLDSLVSQTKCVFIRLFERDDVAIYNSIPTAEGTLKMAIENTDITIHDSDVAVLGLGRVGMTVARTFAAIGANVKVGARKKKDLARIKEMGLKAFHLKNLADEVKEIDLCINTIPHKILHAGMIANMSIHTTIIDLASKPGGTDFRFAEKRGIRAILAPGLPGIVAPKTAGQILANCLTDLLTEVHEGEL